MVKKNLSDIEELKNVLGQLGLKPKDYLGQNFLVDEIALQKIIQSADLKKTDTVVEVGPGLGVLTEELCKSAGEVWAIEKDHKLIPVLKKRLSGYSNLKLVEHDILTFHLEKNIQTDYKVIANIPYYLTSKLFQHFLNLENKPKLLVLMVQKEVGERVIAAPGDLSILGISVQVFSDAEIIAQVPKTSFWPIPKVDSVVLKITPRNKYPEIVSEQDFFRIIKIAFAGKRKQIHNTLSNGLKLPKEKIQEVLSQAKIEATARPQDLSIEDWIRLKKALTL